MFKRTAGSTGPPADSKATLELTLEDLMQRPILNSWKGSEPTLSAHNLASLTEDGGDGRQTDLSSPCNEIVEDWTPTRSTIRGSNCQKFVRNDGHDEQEEEANSWW